MTSLWVRWHSKSPASRLFTQPFIQTQIKENIKVPRHWPLCGEVTEDRWFPAQRASNAENYLMTSSWKLCCVVLCGILAFCRWWLNGLPIRLLPYLSGTHVNSTSSTDQGDIFIYRCPRLLCRWLLFWYEPSSVISGTWTLCPRFRF